MTIHFLEKLITSANCLMIMSPIIGAVPGAGPVRIKDTTDDKPWGIVDVSVCNLRQSGDYDAGMASQALLAIDHNKTIHGFLLFWLQKPYSL